MRAAVRKMNNMVVTVALATFYILGIGIASLVRRGVVFFKAPSGGDSFWRRTSSEDFARKGFFESPY